MVQVHIFLKFLIISNQWIIKIFLESLPSKIYYRKTSDLTDDFCTWEDDKVQTTKNQLNIYEGIKNDLDNIMRVLCYLSFKEKGNSCDEQCHYLYYWIGNILFNKLKEENSVTTVIDVLNNFSRNLGSSQNCRCIFPKGISEEEFTKLKIVHDYCKDYETIQHNITYKKIMCNDEFSSYLVKATSTYDNLYRECVTTNSKEYCVEVKKQVPTCFQKKLSTLSCQVQDVSHQGLDEETSALAKQSGTMDEQSTFNLSQILMLATLPIAGILFFSFIIYNFTPFVSRIRKYLVKRKLVRHNLNYTDRQELTEYTSLQPKSNVERRQINIAFHS
ncbi:PIR protein [Plasmodium malariae]|uniref:PIR protein n=1 Tax=Plasmodium malariae TaxID=5858 RepID=A0A1D3JJ21_PLAMA|nr:PIR protein [Plasmodium malariae]SBT86375.1 PIR protein [Plasmodium malariae]